MQEKKHLNKILVVLPARGGSKRIENKNIIPLLGQPMIYWPLSELSKVFSREQILVSTDNERIIKVVEKKGVKVPFRRPKSLSDDYTEIVPVVLHALNWFEKYVKKVSYVLVVYPTAVLLQKENIFSALNTISTDKNCDCVIAGTSYPYPIQRALFENSEGYAQMFEPNQYKSRSQDLQEALHDAGQFFITKSESVKNGKVLINSNVKIEKLDRSKVIDIDDYEDLNLAELKMRRLKKESDDYSWSF